jgi:hypothetical protein
MRYQAWAGQAAQLEAVRQLPIQGAAVPSVGYTRLDANRL